MLVSVGANCVRPKISISEIVPLVDKNIGKLNDIYETVRFDKYVIMPDHIHLIVVMQNGRTQFAPTVSRDISKTIPENGSRINIIFDKQVSA